MPNEKLVFALEQKILLLEKTSDLTKQVEVRSKQKEIRLEDLLDKRQVLLDRVEKCNRMINSCAAALAAEPRSRMERILAGKASQDECSPDETVLLRYSLKCLSLLRTIVAENAVAESRVREERNRLQKALGELRKSANTSGGIFHSH